MYSVKECFRTIQGEGINAGRAAVFLRFSGCNLWSGFHALRSSARGSCAHWCDTDFVGTDGAGGGRFETPDELAHQAKKIARGIPLLVATGGEPLLQLDPALIEALRWRGFEIAVETNGTIPRPDGIDWLCVSPKVGAPLMIARCDELKVVYPQRGMDLEAIGRAIESDYRLVQPMWGPGYQASLAACLQWIDEHPDWRLSTQTHKLIGIM